MGKKVDKVSTSKMWLVASIVATLVPWVGNFIIGSLYPVDGLHNNEISQASGILTLTSLAALILILVALFHVKGKSKLIVIVGIASTLYVGYLAFFSYTWLMSSPF